MKIKKRDGRIVDFDSTKIKDACMAAGCTGDQGRAVARDVIARLGFDETELISDQVWETSVEEVQDLVEASLMDASLNSVAKAYILYRNERSKLRVWDTGVHPDVISEFMLRATYAKDGESWRDVVDRNIQMHSDKYPDHAQEIEDVFNNFVYTKKVMPAMRSVQFAGKAIERNHARMYNCAYSACNRFDFFGETFFLLLSGCGVGFSVRSRHVRKLPSIKKVNTSKIIYHRVDDTIEGWAYALEELIKSTFEGKYVEFNYEDIRPLGAPLRVTGGTAPGHIPLKEALEGVRKILLARQGSFLSPLDCADIVCIVAEAVYAGGIRRSSLICLFDPKDTEMMKCKIGDWYEDHPYRRMMNISAAFNRYRMDREDFDSVMRNCQEWGEPGYRVFADDDYGTNPCGEIGLAPTENAFQFCNLCEINGATVANAEDFYERCKAAAFIGTLQAGYTRFHFLNPETRKVTERDALIGVSITGISDRMRDIFSSAELLLQGALSVVEANERTANKIGINPAARCTTIKPSGNSSLFLGCVGSGIHPHHAERYLRRIRRRVDDPIVAHIKEQNPAMVDICGDDAYVTFAVKAPENATLRKNYDALTFLDTVKHFYQNWISPGTTNEAANLSHSISATVTVKPDDWEALADQVWKNAITIPTLSFLAEMGDHDYKFAPRESADTPETIAKWRAIAEGNQEIDWSTFVGSREIGAACEGPVCEIQTA